MVAGNYFANVAGLDSVRVLVAMVALCVAGLVGARLWFVATHWRIYRHAPERIWRRSEGGASLAGGLLLAAIVSVPLLDAIGLPFAEFLDVATFTSLIGLFFGRFGCLLHGCCSGVPTEGRLGLPLSNHGGVWRCRIPSQLLDAGLERSGTVEPDAKDPVTIYFTWDGFEELDGITITISLTSVTPSQSDPSPTLVNSAIQEKGSRMLKGPTFESQGTVTCTCAVSRSSAGNPPPQTLVKNPNDFLPGVHMSRDGNGGFKLS